MRCSSGDDRITPVKKFFIEQIPTFERLWIDSALSSSPPGFKDVTGPGFSAITAQSDALILLQFHSMKHSPPDGSRQHVTRTMLRLGAHGSRPTHK
jgi:hypothetical protein